MVKKSTARRWKTELDAPRSSATKTSPANVPTQHDSMSLDVTSVGLRSWASTLRWKSTLNWVQ